jgi:mannose-6-phosphate isomerase-like protein (cupin superfamily)
MRDEIERTDFQWARPLEITGDERSRALDAADAALASWGLTMPAVDPLTLDFGLGEFTRIGETEYCIVNNRDRNYCGKFLLLFDGQRCPLHHHNSKHETFFIVRGEVAMQCDGAETTLRSGDTLQVAPGTDHTFAAVDGPALVLEVSEPSVERDNVFADRRIGTDGIL